MKLLSVVPMLIAAVLLGLPSLGDAHPCRAGERPPTPEEQAYIDSVLQTVTVVPPNELSRVRAKDEAERAKREGRPLRALLDRPTAVDNSADPATRKYFPPIGYQEVSGPCAAWAAGYYWSTYTQAKDEGYDVSGGDISHICSPAFLYNLHNDGLNDGVNLAYLMARLSAVGCSSLSLMPYSGSDCTSWPSDEAWKNALHNRTLGLHAIDGSTSEGVDAVKQHLANGDLAVVGCAWYENMDLYPCMIGCAGISNEVYYAPDGKMVDGHAATLVGYDDYKYYEDEYGQFQHGAFLLANSYSSDWGVSNTAGGDSRGFFWVAYSAFTNSAFARKAYYCDDRPHYQPKLYALVGINHPRRGDVELRGGISGWFSYEPVGIRGGAPPVTDAQPIAIDLSDGLPASTPPDTVLTVSAQLHVKEGSSANGSITSAAFYEDLDSDGIFTEILSPNPPVTVLPNSWGYARAYLPDGSPPPVPGRTERASVSSAGEQGDGRSGDAVGSLSISGDGRFAAFESSAKNLVPDDTNWNADIFVRDRLSSTTERVSVSSTGGQAILESRRPSISADGRFVAFVSGSPDLVPGDTNRVTCDDVFVHDRTTGITERVSVSSSGEESNDSCDWPSISADGRFVAFASLATNLVAGDTNGATDVFVRDRLTGTTERVSVSSGGEQANAAAYAFMISISADGRFVGFSSLAANLDPNHASRGMFLHDRTTGATELVSVDSLGQPVRCDEYLYDPDPGTISADGRYATFSTTQPDFLPGDTNGVEDVFLHDRLTGVTDRISIGSLGEQGNYASDNPSVSGDGRFVAFRSISSNLLPPHTSHYPDVLVKDRLTSALERASISSLGDQANGWPYDPIISVDGTCVAFFTSASNLVPGDTNAYEDVFVRTRGAVAAHALQVTVTADPPEVESGGTVQLNAAAEDSMGHQVTWRWVDMGDWGESGGGTFSPGTGVSAPIYTAPRNTRLDSKPMWLFAIAICDGSPAVCESVGVEISVKAEDPFSDLPAGYWAMSSIEACVSAGIVGGYPDGSYRPDVVVTRDQMAVYIARALALGDANVPTGPAVATFPDVPTDYWAFRYVEYCYASGVVGGYWDGYRPGEPVNRAQMAVYVARAMAGGDASVPDDPDGTPFFPDVPADYWAYKYVEYCHDQEVVGGYWDGYRPEEAVNRAQMAVYVQRAFHLPM